MSAFLIGAAISLLNPVRGPYGGRAMAVGSTRAGDAGGRGDAPAPARPVLPLRTLVAFGAPAAGYAFYLFFIQFYFLNYGTDVLLLGAALPGLLLLVGRLFDAVTDPLAGWASDRTRSRWGRRRPWMLAAIPLLALSFVMVWSPPADLSQAALVAWLAGSLLLFYTGFTIYTVPHQSLGAELSLDHHERSRIFGAQRMAFVFGMIVAFVGIQVARNAADPRAGASVVAWAAVAGSSLLLLAAPVWLRERPEHQGRGGSGPFDALRDVWRNPHARVLLTVWFVEGLGGGVLGVLAPFITLYVLRRPDLIALIPSFFVVAGVLSIPLWIALSRRFGKRDVWLAAICGNGLFFGATFFVQEGQLPLLCLLLVGAGASNACGGAIGASMLADVIDTDELATGERKEGAYTAAWSFALKLAIGCVVGLTGVALELAGFRPNQEQTRLAELTLRGLFAGAPALAALVALVVLRRFTLDVHAHARVRAQLDARA
jgi:GPH family glycoside/pentoside/hexuronide:cation symporter